MRGDQRREIKAVDYQEAGVLCKKKYGFWPESVEAKAFEPRPQLTYKLGDLHPGLKDLIKNKEEDK